MARCLTTDEFIKKARKTEFFKEDILQLNKKGNK